MDVLCLRKGFVALLAMACSLAGAQPWSTAYEEGLKAAGAKDWAAAREGFRKAIGYRPDDVSGPTNLPGPAGEQRQWRNGSPYSPNFLAAYASYRIGLNATDVSVRDEAFKTASAEWETLLAKGQNSKETFYFLTQIYNATSNAAARQALQARLGQVKSLDWKVDTSVVLPEDIAALNQAIPAPGNVVAVKAGDPLPAQGSQTVVPLTPMAPSVPKFALIIGNSESKLPGGVPFAADDAQTIRDGLIASGGYLEANTELVVNATAQQMIASASALASRVPEGAPVVIFFSGVGTNLDGRDYLAGVDTELPNDTSTMVAKAELFRLFMERGAKIFAFFQVDRTIREGRYFGQEFGLVGSISQVQATKPGDGVYSVLRGGKNTGLFTNAFVGVLAELGSNQIPIMEFGWQLFYRMRRGETGTTGGGSRQVPTLPVLTNMASDARF
jgi:hypothetical protein